MDCSGIDPAKLSIQSDRASRFLARRLVSRYLREYATCEADPLCPELKAYNTRFFSEFWKICVEYGHREPPYWSIVWPGGRALARFVLDQPQNFKGHKILDLGCGNGLASLALCRVGGVVTAVDVSIAALLLLRRRAREYGYPIDCVPANFLNWPDELFRGFDLVIMGDLFYEEPLAKRATAILKFLSREGIAHYASDALRLYRPQKDVRTVVSYSTPVFPEIESVKERTVQIIQMVQET
ncbi:MAG: methyltransferase [Spirochaetales bacterium]|nr:methyltransferase [Spirochaetales bacterium]